MNVQIQNSPRNKKYSPTNTKVKRVTNSYKQKIVIQLQSLKYKYTDTPVH